MGFQSDILSMVNTVANTAVQGKTISELHNINKGQGKAISEFHNINRGQGRAISELHSINELYNINKGKQLAAFDETLAKQAMTNMETQRTVKNNQNKFLRDVLDCIRREVKINGK